MALIKQGGCLKGYWQLLARKSFIFLLVVSLSSLALPAQAKNHFIVLFDGSGSMVRNSTTRIQNPFWRGQVGNYSDMAQVMSNFINKIATEIELNAALRSSGFKNFDTGEDIFSFLIFVADWDNPNFAPEELFYTDTDLLARGGLLPTSRDYRFFDIRPGRAADNASVSLSNVFSGHSPIIAATNLSMPFIADKIHEQGNGIGQALRPRENEFALDTVVDNIFIIRISDGQYNSRSNGSDEHNVVQRNADEAIYASGTPGITQDAQEGFERYQNISGQVTRAFDIGVREAQCAFSTPNQNYDLNQPLNCNDDAYDNVKDWGTGLLINYLKVEPKAPGVGVLARTDASEVKLRMIYRYADSGQPESGVRWTGENTIRMDSSVNNEGPFNILPKEGTALQYNIGEGNGNDWQKCELREKLGLCENAGGPGFDFSPATLPGSVRYRASYVLEFNRQQGSMLYPYRIALKPVEWKVNLARAEAAPDDILYKLPRDPGDPPSLHRLHPHRLFSDTALQLDNLETLPIDNPGTLKGWAEKWRPDIKSLLDDEDLERSSPVLPWMLARVSREKKYELSSQEQSMNTVARLLYGVGIILLVIFFIRPRRKPDAELTLSHDGRPIDLDFDHRYKQGELFLAAHLDIENKQEKYRLPTGLKDIQARLSPLNEGGDKPEGLKLKDPESSPFAVNMPGKRLYKEKEIPAQKGIPVYFHPGEIIDLERTVAENPVAELDLPMRIDLTVGGLNKTLHAKLPLKISPERGELDIEIVSEQRIEPGDTRVREAYYKYDEKVEVCIYRLSHRAKHHYSHRVEGELKIEIEEDANSERYPGAEAVLLSSPRGHKTVMEFDLGHKGTEEFIVLADCSKLRNPDSCDHYKIKISKKLLNGHLDTDDEPEWEPCQDWTLRLLRSKQRTDVSMQVSYGEQEDMLLNKDRKHVEDAFEVGSAQEPKPIHSENSRENAPYLFKVRLANHCLDGHGEAKWAFECNIISMNTDSVRITQGSFLLKDTQGKIIEPMRGDLKDSQSPDENKKELLIYLNLDKVKIDKRDFAIKCEVMVHWEIYEDGLESTANPEKFTTERVVICHLRHKPPQGILAIDFGTSALAVAYANRIDNAKLLPLHELLSELHKTNSRCFDDPHNPESDYLASVVNVNIHDAALSELRPESPEFLDLPMKQIALYKHTKKCCSSIKALISAGFNTLPVHMTGSYLSQESGKSTTESPPLYSVLVGAYKGLLKNFIEPLLQKRNQRYSHVLVTHPNTYNPHHVLTLRSILNKAFKETATAAELYPENIDCMSESDAVAYYYLIQEASKRHDGNYPDHERILIYDIGAGTLDLTYLEVHWNKDEATPTPKNNSRVLRRTGVTIAGDRLDECIARDLHTLLNKELSDKGLYITHIVADVPPHSEAPKMEEQEIRLMDELRQRIQTLKRKLSNNEQNIELKLTGWKEDTGIQLVKTDLQNTPQLYNECRQLKGTASADVFWKTTPIDIEKGAFVKGFLEQVTREELQLFFNDDIPPVDTLIISGRTSLWPGFKQRVLSTLKNGSRNKNLAVVSFEDDPDTLKRAVVMGVLERKFCWDSIRLKEPNFVGIPGLRYYKKPNEKKAIIPCGDYIGKFRTHDVSYASYVEIGFQVGNKFLVHNSFDVSDTKKVEIQLNLDERGSSIRPVIRKKGHEDRLVNDKNFPTLPSPKHPWPLGEKKLVKMRVQDLLEAD